MNINLCKSVLDLSCAMLVLLIIGLISFSCVDPSEMSGEMEITSQVEDWRDEIIYQVLVDRFANGDPSNDYNIRPDAPAAYHGGDYQGIIDKLDYIEELGVTALWISPVVKNVEEDAGVDGYHGYWTQNFVEVNRHFGDLAKLRELVKECHDRGIKVILDIVANHVGQLFYYDINKNGYPNDLVIGSGDKSPITRTTEWDPDFDERGIQAFTSLGPSGAAPVSWVWQPEINRVPPWPPEFANEEWYNRMGRVTVWGREKRSCFDAGKITEAEYNSGTYWKDFKACEEYVRLQEVRGDFPGGLKDLNTSLPEVQKALTDAYAYWIEAADFDAFRIDTLKHVEHEFWQYFCPEIRKKAKSLGKKNFFMFGEAFDGDDKLIGSYTFNNEVDSVFYFSQMFTLQDVFKSGGATKKIEDLWNNRFPDKSTGKANNYGITPHVNGPVDATGTPIKPYQMMVNFIDNHDIPRFLYGNNNVKAMHNALALLLTMDGIPCIYYGTEQNFNGGNDPANREDLWKAGYNTTNETFKWIKQLINLRKTLVPLRKGDLKIVWASKNNGKEQDAGIFAFERSYTDPNGKNSTVLIAINSSEDNTAETSATSFGGGDMITSFAAGTKLKNVLEESDPVDDVTVGAGGTVKLKLQPRSAKVFVVR